MNGQGLGSNGNSNPMGRLKIVIRDLSDRVRRLEHRQTVSLGSWRLSEDSKTGDLIAHNTDSGVTAVVARRIPEADEEGT